MTDFFDLRNSFCHSISPSLLRVTGDDCSALTSTSARVASARNVTEEKRASSLAGLLNKRQKLSAARANDGCDHGKPRRGKTVSDFARGWHSSIKRRCV